MTRVKRPFGIFVGASLCIVGMLLLLSRFLLMAPFYVRGMTRLGLSQSYWHLAPIWRFVWTAPVWPIAGLCLLCLGIVQFIFGSTKLKRQKAIV